MGKGWVCARDVSIGDKLHLYSDGVVEVNAVEEKFLKEPVKVYNLEVEDWHDYYVSELDVLVHNCDKGSSKDVVTVEQIKQLGWTSATGTMVKDLNRVLIKYDITTPERIRYFISQTMKESNKGLWLTEAGWCSIAVQKDYCKQYDNRKDLGNKGEGEGFKFRGAGYIQVTGRNNYQAFANAIGDREILNQGADYVVKNYAWEAAGYWWKNNNVNAVVDRGTSTREITLKVNPGLIYNTKELNKQINERGNYYNQTVDVFK